MRGRIFVVLMLCLIGVSCDRQDAKAQQQIDEALSAHAPPPGLPSLAPMLAKVSPAVVNVSVRGTQKVAVNPLFQDPFFRQFFGLNQAPSTEQFQAVGSGVIIDAQRGLVVTNNHVVKNAQDIEVTLSDRRQFTAKLIGTDPQTDIAVLKIRADNLIALPLGNSHALKVGDYVVAVGDPFGLGQTATFGIVSALGRSGLGIEGYEDFIQTDAAINPGNSGGALVNMAGQFVGMNTAMLSQNGASTGVGFAIPVDMVRTIAQDLILRGKVARGELGVAVQDLTPSLAQAMGLNLNSGALVAQVMPGSAAARAGLKPGDVITGLDGNPLANSSDLRIAIADKPPGTVVHLAVSRNGHAMTLNAMLAPLAANAAEAEEPAEKPGSLLSGVTVGAIPQDNPYVGKIKGVYVENVDPMSPAAIAGLQQGDIIVSVDRNPVDTTGAFNNAIRQHRPGRPLLLEIARDNGLLFIAIG